MNKTLYFPVFTVLAARERGGAELARIELDKAQFAWKPCRD